MRVKLLALCVLVGAATSFPACSRRGASTSFGLALHPDASCSSAPVSCVQRLKVDLAGDNGTPAQSWMLDFQINGGPASLGLLPTSGSGKFRVAGLALPSGSITVFSGTSGSVTFDPKNDQSVLIPVSCPAIADPCASGSPSPSPTPRIFTSGTNADLVLGQTNFTNCGDVGGGNAPMQLIEPDGILTDDGTRLFIADSLNGRLQVWNDKTALTNGQNSDFVYGHTNNTNQGQGSDANDRLNKPRGIAWIPGQAILTGDQNNNRVPIYTPTPTTNAPQAAFALGQNSANNDSASNTSQTGLRGPSGVAWSSTAGLFVADQANHRVLGYGTNTATFFVNNAPATVVFGQGASFTTGNANHGAAVDGTGFDTPMHIAIAGKRLYVVDSNNHRVLVWNDITAATSGAAADFAIGQPDLTTHTAGFTGASFLTAPRGVAATVDRLVIADSGNHRVLIWQPVPNASADMPTQILGQADFSTHTANLGGGNGGCPNDGGVNGGTCPGTGLAATAASLSRPSAVWLDGNQLWVSDSCNYRAVRFTAAP